MILEDACTGCGLCLGVCPIPGALYFVPRKTDYVIKRGMPPGPDCPEEHLKVFKPFIPTRWKWIKLWIRKKNKIYN